MLPLATSTSHIRVASLNPGSSASNSASCSCSWERCGKGPNIGVILETRRDFLTSDFSLSRAWLLWLFRQWTSRWKIFLSDFQIKSIDLEKLKVASAPDSRMVVLLSVRCTGGFCPTCGIPPLVERMLLTLCQEVCCVRELSPFSLSLLSPFCCLKWLISLFALMPGKPGENSAISAGV